MKSRSTPPPPPTHTEKLKAIRPDIIIENTKEETCTLIDVALPTDRNVVQKEVEKKDKIQRIYV